MKLAENRSEWSHAHGRRHVRPRSVGTHLDTRVEQALDDGQHAQRRAICQEAAHKLDLPCPSKVPLTALEGPLDQLTTVLGRGPDQS